jgi:pimeloyl-ACP methyl ester carboxylesterase
MNYLQRPDGVAIAYQVHNPMAPETPVLLSHGFGETSGMWAPNIDVLSASRPVIVWDQRGHGLSEAPESMDRYGEHINVADMAAVLDAVGVDRAVIGGMSLGGYLSLAFRIAHPERAAALLLIDTGPGFFKDEARQKWNDWVETLARRLEARETQDATAETNRLVHLHPEGLPRAARGALVQRNSRVIASLAGIDVPTLVIVGAQDKKYRRAADYLESHISSAQKVVVDGAGHAVNLDNPNTFNTVVCKFLKEQ